MSYLNQLRTFLAVYQYRSFSKAANTLGITQPAASQHIQSLESLIGKALFIRQSRGVLPTEVADDLALSVNENMAQLERKLASFRFSQQKGGTVHIAAPQDFTHYILAPKLAPLLADGFLLRFHTGDRSAILTMLAQERVDFAVLASPPDPTLYDSVPIFDEQLLCVFAPHFAEKMGGNQTVMCWRICHC